MLAGIRVRSCHDNDAQWIGQDSLGFMEDLEQRYGHEASLRLVVHVASVEHDGRREVSWRVGSGGRDLGVPSKAEIVAALEDATRQITEGLPG